jgi:hypothetical protein
VRFSFRRYFANENVTGTNFSADKRNTGLVRSEESLFNVINATREISSNYFKTYEVSISNSPQNIKLNLLEKHKDIPNPATWVFNSPNTLPLLQTLLPLAKEKLAKIIDK